MTLLSSYQAGLVSIVIPVSHRPDLVRVCLDSIKAYTPEPHEIIVVCDAVVQEDFAFLGEYNLTVLGSTERLGFPKTVNKGIEAARGEFILVLNSDTVVIPGWMAGMLEAFKRDPEVGMVAPTFSETGGIQHIDNNKAGKEYDYVDEVKGVAMFFKREALLKIGLFDERFGLGGGEDNDICMRVKLAGLKTVVARKSFIYHYGSASFRELFDHDITYSKKYSCGVFYKFREKWKNEKALHYKPRIFIAIPNNGWIHPELAVILVNWSHDPEVSIKLFMPHGLSPLDNARNTCVKEFLEDYWDYLLFIDNDIVPPINALRDLLAEDKDIIAPVCFMWMRDFEGQGFPLPVAHRYAKNGEYAPHIGTGVEETDVVSGGMFLVKRPVYEKMDRPFAFTYHRNGTVIYSEDFYFSQQAQKLGYSLYTHYGVVCKHFRQLDIREVNNLLVKNG